MLHSMRSIALIPLLLATNVAAATLDVQFEGLKNAQGILHIAVISDQAGWDHTKAPVAVRDVDLASTTQPVHVRFDGLDPASYAVDAYQDVNANGKLDLNFMHIPKEPVGSSRNPDVWRRPHFGECMFPLPPEGTTITVTMK